MMMTFPARTIENVWYLNSAAKFHITYDGSDFKIFIPESLFLFQTTDDTAFLILRKGTVLKEVLVNCVLS